MEFLHRRFHAVLAAILVAGFGAALAVLVLADVTPPDPLGESKRYVHDMVLYGGKANMVLGEAAQWLGSLLHGKRLAGALAAATLLAAGAFWYFFAPPRKSPPPGKDA
ncbi:MAG TPA: hypothetical protein VFV71_08775 [Burkholderiales bacterium]|nr:hypothetical protein [Burkholderiales bacterium]